MLALAFSLLNTVMLGAGIVAAHGTGPVTNDAVAAVRSPARIYLPYVITSGIPLAVWAAIVVGVAFIVGEITRLLQTRQLPDNIRRAYREQAEAFSNQVPDPMNYWYSYGVAPPSLRDSYPDVMDWERRVARAQLRGRVLPDASWLLWGIVGAQLVILWCTGSSTCCRQWSSVLSESASPAWCCQRGWVSCSRCGGSPPSGP